MIYISVRQLLGAGIIVVLLFLGVQDRLATENNSALYLFAVATAMVAPEIIGELVRAWREFKGLPPTHQSDDEETKE